MRGLGVLLVLVAGCGGGGGGGGDDADAGGYQIAAPAAPALPTWACPAGWREVTDGDVTTCDPYPESGVQDCAVDEAHFPGEPGCARVGTPCPAGEWPEGLPAGPIIYVRAGGAAGGDGTQALPFGTIAEALAGSATNAIIAIGKGTYDEMVTVGGTRTLWGACVAETRVASSTPATMSGTIYVPSGSVSLRNLQLGGARPGLVVASPSATVSAQDLVVAGGSAFGLVVIGGTMTGQTIVVRDTLAGGGPGRGFYFGLGAQVDLERVAAVNNREIGVFIANQGTVVTLADLVVRDTQAAAGVARGVEAQDKARLDIARGALERNQETGLAAYHGDTLVTLADLLVRDSLHRGLDVGFGARLDVARATLDGNRDDGAAADGTGTIMTLTDVTVRDTQSAASDGLSGRGVNAQLGAHVELTRVALLRNQDLGVFAGGAGTTATLTDLVIRDTRRRELDRQNGGAIAARDGAGVAVTRALFERNRAFGVYAQDAATLVTLTDVVVTDTESQESDGRAGMGIAAQTGARFDVVRGRFERNRAFGVFAEAAGTIVTLADVVIADTRGQQGDLQYGRGLEAQYGATVDVVRASFERNRDVGVIAAGPGTFVALTDIVVTGTQDQECETAGTCVFEWRVAAAVGSYDGALLDVHRFVFTGSAFLGVQLGGGGADLHEGEVSSNAIGANVQTADFDIGRLQDRVVWRDNDITLDSSGLPVPMPGTPLLGP